MRTLKNIRTFVPNFKFWTKMNINEEGKYCNHNLAPVEYPTSGSLQLCQNGYNNTLFLLIKKSFYFGLRVLNDRLLNLRLIYDNLRSPQQTPLADHFPKIAGQLLIIIRKLISFAVSVQPQNKSACGPQVVPSCFSCRQSSITHNLNSIFLIR